MMKTLTLFKRMQKHLLGMGAVIFMVMFFAIKISAQANFSFAPTMTTVGLNATFNVQVQVDLNQGTNTVVDVAEAYVNFDPTYLQVQSITNGGTLTRVALSEFDNTAGTIDYSAGASNSNGVTTDFTLLTITFVAIAAPATGTTALIFNSSLPRQTNAYRSGNSVLGATTNGTVFICPTGECSPLPVNLTDLKATAFENDVTIKWSTASESNNSGFEIQRSLDGATWSAITFVQGAGNSNTIRNYIYVDKNLAPRVYLYRLKQVDIDSRFKYSPIVSARVTGKAEFVLEQNHPNPASGITTISYILPQSEYVLIGLYDGLGKQIKVLVSEEKSAGVYFIDINTSNLSKGIYYYKMRAGAFTATRKMVLK
jgi:hypothetical protein